jgi:hypothetical protein
MTILTARYPSKCAATGAPIRRGDTIQYDHATRTARLLTVDEERSYAGKVTDDYLAGRAAAATRTAP